jgi:hypothetical protein
MVAGWLEAYRTATSYMSSTKQTTLSSVYSIFTALQDDLRDRLHNLDDHLPPELALGLQNALLKLSEYFSKTDASPYYLWSSCTHFILASGAAQSVADFISSSSRSSSHLQRAAASLC